MKRGSVLLCALYLVLAYGTAFAESPTQAALSNIPPAWSKTLQCDTEACPRFELVMGGEAVLDHETGLVWEQSPSTDTLSWYTAQLQCNQNVKKGGRLGWRLPTIQELASLVDPAITRQGPALPSGHPFSNVQPIHYWSANTMDGSPDFAWNLNFDNGRMNYAILKSESLHIWCVRGGHGVDLQ